MDSPAIAARRLHMPVVLAVGGAVVLMAGVCLALIGEARQLDKSSGWPRLIMPGLALAGAGFALGIAAAIVAALSPAWRGVRGGRAAGEATDDSFADPADEGPSSLRGGAVRSVGGLAGEADSTYSSLRRPAASQSADQQDGGRPMPEYADEGWRLDPAALGGPPEVHHPVR